MTTGVLKQYFYTNNLTHGYTALSKVYKCFAKTYNKERKREINGLSREKVKTLQQKETE